MLISRKIGLFLGVSAIAVTGAPAPLLAQAPAPQAAAAEPDEGAVIIVTGTRRTDRTVADSTVPIDVIGGEALARSGFTETNKVLNQLVPSFNFPQPSLTDGTDSLRPASLRGLSPDQVLVLVNGKRRHASALLNLNGSVGRGSSAVDLNEIPPIAIERIEVLRDGAASQYGSDAIAGVINIQLKKASGITGTITYGQYDTNLKGVADVTGVQVGANGLPVVVTPSSNSSNDILGLTTTGKDKHRSDGEIITVATNIGVALGAKGYFNFTAQYSDRSPTNRSGADPRRQYVTVGDPNELTFDRYSHRYGDGKARDYNFFMNSAIDLGENFQLYSFGSYGIRQANGAGFYRRSNDARNRDFAASTTSFVPFYPNGFLPLIVSDIVDSSIAVGIKGTLADWNVDLSAVNGANRLQYDVANTFNTSLGGKNSPVRFDAGSLRSGQTSINLDVSRDVTFGGLKSVTFAAGAEYRRDAFRITAGDVGSYINGPFSVAPFNAAGGSQVFPGFRPNNALDVSRHSVAGYVELDADINDQITVQAAGRYEHYSDFGSTVNGKFAARWEPIKGYALRGSVSTGFRAPSLAQQFFTTTSTNNVAGQLIEVGTFGVADPVAVALGSKPLKAEKSTNFSVGAALNPFHGLNLTIDYYNIKIRDRIVLSENLTGAAVVNLLVGAGINNVTSARFFINGIDTRTQGVDVVASYRLPEFGAGNFNLSAGFNRNTTKILSRAVLPSLPGLLLFGRTESFRITDGQPRDKFNAGVDWDKGIFSATVRTTRYGEVFLAGSSAAITVPKGGVANDFTLSPKWITDMEVRVKPLKGMEVAVGANNVFDVYPDRLPAGGAFGSNNFFLPYSSLSPFGFNGRFLYARVTVHY